MNTNKKKEHDFMMGDVFDKDNGWSDGERVGGFFLGLLIDPITLIGKGLNKIGIETEGDLDESDFKNP